VSDRRLILLRHAKSSWKDPALEDHARPLAGRGVRDGAGFGRWLCGQLPTPDLVLCSDARRTRDTLAFLIPELVDPRRVAYERALYHAPAEALLARLQQVPEDAPCVLLVGHNPGLSDLVNLLVEGARGAVDDLPTFGVAGFELRDAFAELDAGRVRLTTLLRPKDFDG
jgi:phosphohistidine phosphatase